MEVIMHIASYLQCREIKTNRVLDFVYEEEPSFKVSLMDSEGQVRQPGEVGEIEIIDAPRDRQPTSRRDVVITLRPIWMPDMLAAYRRVVALVLRDKGFTVVARGMTDEDVPDHEWASKEEALVAPRYFMGTWDGREWAASHACVQDVIALALKRGTAGRFWSDFFVADEDESIHPSQRLAMYLLGAWEMVDEAGELPDWDKSSVLADADEFWNGRGRDAAYVRGFADGVLSLRDEDGFGVVERSTEEMSDCV